MIRIDNSKNQEKEIYTYKLLSKLLGLALVAAIIAIVFGLNYLWYGGGK